MLAGDLAKHIGHGLVLRVTTHLCLREFHCLVRVAAGEGPNGSLNDVVLAFPVFELPEKFDGPVDVAVDPVAHNRPQGLLAFLRVFQRQGEIGGPVHVLVGHAVDDTRKRLTAGVAGRHGPDLGHGGVDILSGPEGENHLVLPGVRVLSRMQ